MRFSRLTKQRSGSLRNRSTAAREDWWRCSAWQSRHAAPTVSTVRPALAPHNAFQLLRLAEEFDLTIAEDDRHGEPLPSRLSDSAARLAPRVQLSRVICVGGCSKTLGSGLRVGCFAARAEPPG